MDPEIKALLDLSQQQGEQFAGLAQQHESLMTQHKSLLDEFKRTPAHGAPDPRGVFGAGPAVRTGEDPLTSRGFSCLKMLGLLTGAVEAEEAKVELELHHKLHGCYTKDLSEGGRYNYKSGHKPGQGAFLAPFCTGFMQDSAVSRQFRHEMKDLMNAGTDGYDPDEARWIRTKNLQMKGYSTKDLSWLNELTGGALVPPPEQGELIELLRNQEALVNAGARVVPLPPQGRIEYPRQTAASLTYWVGENAPITASDIGTGTVHLQAKKLAVLIKAPNELIRFASPAAEALIRDDMTKSLALGLDLAGLEGAGGDNVPRGILNMPNINRINSSVQTANGDLVTAQDIYRMIAAVEESNAEFEGFIMRPKTLYKYYQLRADAVAQGDSQGVFVFNLIREAGEGIKPLLGGKPVTKSTQVSQSRAKGSATNLTYIIGGMWSDLLIGMFGAIEFSQTNQGDTSFVNDQTWVKGILSADVQARHEAAFVLMDNIDTTLTNVQ